MPVNIYVLVAAVGIVTGVGGMIIGYYQSKAHMADDYISRGECENCAMKVEIINLIKDMTDATKVLKEGAEMFTKLRIDMAVVKTKLGIKDDLVELKNMVNILENGDVQE